MPRSIRKGRVEWTRRLQAHQQSDCAETAGFRVHGLGSASMDKRNVVSIDVSAGEEFAYVAAELPRLLFLAEGMQKLCNAFEAAQLR